MSNYRYENYNIIRDLKRDIPYHIDDIVDLLEGKDIHIKKLEEEIKQLKVSQKQLAISELKKVEEILWNSQDLDHLIDNDEFLDELNHLIKSLKGE